MWRGGRRENRKEKKNVEKSTTCFWQTRKLTVSCTSFSRLPPTHFHKKLSKLSQDFQGWIIPELFPSFIYVFNLFYLFLTSHLPQIFSFNPSDLQLFRTYCMWFFLHSYYAELPASMYHTHTLSRQQRLTELSQIRALFAWHLFRKEALSSRFPEEKKHLLLNVKLHFTCRFLYFSISRKSLSCLTWESQKIRNWIRM